LQDLLSRFHGSWELRPIKDSSSGKVTGCHAVLSQDVLPKGECEQCLNLYVCLLLLCIL
jgi:hypothetical protein